LIPSFSAMVDGKMEVTKPIKVKVLKAVKGMKRETKDFSLDMKIEKSKFYVGEPIVLNLYFKQRINSDVVKIEYAPPAFKEFFSKQLGKGKTYKKDGFSIQELTYLLIAKKSGKLTVEAVIVGTSGGTTVTERSVIVVAPILACKSFIPAYITTRYTLSAGKY